VTAKISLEKRSFVPELRIVDDGLWQRTVGVMGDGRTYEALRTDVVLSKFLV
jgi:hypothetical protein